MNNDNTAINGIHHITAITSSAADNLAFYESTLELRMVKQTVNFDDPNTYHLYYGDTKGNPGTILTFFPWEHLPRGRQGAGMMTAVAFEVAPGALSYWSEKLSAAGVAVESTKRFGETVLRFTDPDGLPLELVATNDVSASTGHAIRGFHSATAVVHSETPMHRLLTERMGMTPVAREGRRIRYVMENNGAPGRYVDVVVDTDAPAGRQGAGTVHHIAFRTRTPETQRQWQDRLHGAGIAVTDVRDRKYFQSIYFHTPDHILFEIATDPPGFGVDEPESRLGASLQLPAEYEPSRERIERQLPVLRPGDFQHLFLPPAGVDSGRTLVTLHGTGGNEHDLVDLAHRIDADAALISPRGKVLENGMPRWFRRLAEGVFDEADVAARAGELADFIMSAAIRYGRDPGKMTVLGYSNGANIAAAVLLLRPDVFSSAVLLRPMMPLETVVAAPNLTGKRILILRGDHDRVIPGAGTDRLIRSLTDAGADVASVDIPAGHELTPADISQGRHWLSGLRQARTAAVP